MELKKTLNWLGGGLALLGCAFVGSRFYEYSEQIDVASIDVYGWLVFSGLIILYGIVGFLLPIAWQQLLAFLNIRVTPQFAVNTYGISQLAKYVPGNIFHLAGRQAIGIASGLPGWALIKATILELIILSITASLFAILILPLLIQGLSLYLGGVLYIIIVTFIILLVQYCYSKELASVIIYYTIFLTYSGFMFVVILSLLLNTKSLTIELVLPICGAYVIAWLAGLITPGAPAGIGVRELVNIIILQQFIAQADLLTAVMLSRIVTVGGDMLFYLIAVMLFRNPACLLYSDSS